MTSGTEFSKTFVLNLSVIHTSLKVKKMKVLQERLNILRDINDTSVITTHASGFAEMCCVKPIKKLSEMDKQINKEREQGLLPDKSQEF